MNKRFIKFTKIALLFTLAMSIFAGCANNSGTQSEGSAQEEQKEMTKVVVSEFRGMNYAAVHIADALGYFEEEGIEVEFAVYGDGPVAFQGMHAGAPGSAPYSFIWSILEEGGLNPAEDVTFAQMQYGASIAALEQGTIDASYMDHYNRNKFSAIGANFLVDGADMETKKRVFGSEKFEGSIITATKKFVDENPETVQSFINGVAKGAKWLTSHSDEEVAEVLMPYHDGSTKEDLIERISLIKIAYSPDLKISEEGYEAMENFSLKTGVLKNKVGYENIIDMRFVEQAQ